MSAAAVLARKEASELVLSVRGLSWLLAMASALSVFGLLLVGSTELSLLDNAQVVYDMAGIVVALGALLAVVVGNDSIGGERERGSLVPLLLTPISRMGLIVGKISGVVIAWLIMLAIAVPYFWAVGSTGQNLSESIVGTVLFGTPVVLSFGLFAMGLAARSGSSRASLIGALILLMASGSPLLLGSSLRQSAVGQAFDWINPFSNALNALDAVTIDSQSIASQLPHLGLTIAWLMVAIWFALSGARRLVR